MTSAQESQDVFDTKFTEFCNDLEGALPEFQAQIRAAKALSLQERKTQFQAQVLSSCSPTRDAAQAPAYVLPGVPMPQALWESLSANTKKAIQEYLTILSFTLLMESGIPQGEEGQWTAEWAKTMMDDMKKKMESVDFKGMTEKFQKIFGSFATDASGGLPSLPEKFLKGQIAKLAEEMLKELSFDDFGISEATMAEANKDPSRAFQIVMDVFMRNPQTLQTTIAKMTRKLQAKVQSGAIRPKELVAEAEELMKTFSENPQFVELMETFRQSFGFEDQDMARAAGRDGEGRLSLVQQRLRKKLEAKKAKAAGKR